jgi:hypothetical protein
MHGATPTRVSFRRLKNNCHTAIESYIWLVDKFLAVNPDLLERDPQLAEGDGRRYFARSPKELYPASPHLAEDRNYQSVSGGWFASTILDNPLKFKILARLASSAGSKFGEDWTWDSGSMKL